MESRFARLPRCDGDMRLRQPLSRGGAGGLLDLAAYRFADAVEPPRRDPGEHPVHHSPVDVTAKRVHVGRANTGAGVRAVQLTPDTVADIERYMELTTEPPRAPCCRRSTAPATTARTASSTITKLAAETNLVLAEREQPALRDGVSAHALRKTYFTLPHEAGAPPRWVADQGGHSDPSTSLRIYTESLRGRERSQHGQAFDDLLNGDHGRDTEPARPRPSS